MMKAFIETKGPWDGGIGEGFFVLACGNVILLCVCGCYKGRHWLILSLNDEMKVRNGKFDHFLVSQVLTPVVGMYHAVMAKRYLLEFVCIFVF
jgi:membrane protein YdbS with pleckstrin-like domain